MSRDPFSRCGDYYTPEPLIPRQRGMRSSPVMAPRNATCVVEAVVLARYYPKIAHDFGAEAKATTIRQGRASPA